MLRSNCSTFVVLLAGIAAWVASTPAIAQLDAANASSARAAAVETPPAPPGLDEALRRLSLRGQYVLVPVFGRIGADVAPDGFEALAAHRQQFRGATAFVVEVDSDGGSTPAALRIADALLSIGEEVPVILVVRRAVGPAAILLAAADRVFITEPAPTGTLAALEVDLDPLRELTTDESITIFNEALAQRLERSPRREAFEAAFTNGRWELTARDAYSSGLAEPLEGGLGALGRTLRIDPWNSSGRQVEDLLRQSATYAQQLSVYRSRVVARAFASLEAANAAMSQMAAAEYLAASIDPRRHPSLVGEYRAQSQGNGWSVTPNSAVAWQRACDSAIAAWQRASALGDAAQSALRSASADIGSLVTGATKDLAHDAILAEAIDRLEQARSEIESRMAATRARADAARKEAAAISATLKR